MTVACWSKSLSRMRCRTPWCAAVTATSNWRRPSSRNGAAFGNKPIRESDEDALVGRAQTLIGKVEDLAER